MRIPAFFPAIVFCLLTGCTAPAPDKHNARSASGLAYDLMGTGQVVVLIHGTNLDRRMWQEEMQWLSQQARVLRYDMRGQGKSDMPDSAYTNHGDLLALLDELEISQATLVGLSAGAQLALDVALTASHRVRKLVLVSPSLHGFVPQTRPAFLADLMSALRQRDFEAANQVLLQSPIMAVPAQHESLVADMVRKNAKLWKIPYSLVGQLSPLAIKRLYEIQMPVLVVDGERDLEAIRNQADLLADKLANMTRTTIENGGHLLNLTSPVAFREVLSEFLQ